MKSRPQGWTARASKKPNPPAPAARPAARGVSSPFLQDILPDFCKKSVQGGGGTLGRLQILPHPACLLSASCRLLLHPGVPVLGSKTVPENIPKKTSKMTPKMVQTYFCCDLPLISFSATLGSTTFKLDH